MPQTRAASPLYMFLTLLCLGAFLCTGCDDQKSAQSAGSAAEVGVIVVRPQKILFTTELSGRTSPFQIAEVRPQVSGIIQKRLFEEGTDVNMGDTLYQIDPAVYKADLASAKASLARAEANVEPTRLTLKRYKDLVHINAVSRQEYDSANAAWKQALAEVEVNKAAVENARIRLAYTQVIAPISGRIGRSQVTPGALVTENQAQALAVVQQLDPIYVDVTQSSTEVIRLKRNLENGRLQRADKDHASVRLFLEDGTEYPETGTLQFTDVSVNESTGAVTLRAIFPNPRQYLLPGMYVRAVLTEGMDDAAVLLPQRALMRDTRGNASAYVLNANNTVEKRPLRVGRTYKNNWVVLEGLADGDRVVVDGLQKIRPGVSARAVDLSETVSPASAKTE